MAEAPLEPLTLLVQLMMALSLSACAGLRAWLPLLVLGAAGRFELVPLSDSFGFVSSTPALLVFGLATIVELAADKIIAVDHALDALSTLVRPVAGTLLAAAALSDLDPLLATVCGLVIGGSTALTIHAGKAAVRAKSSSIAPLHGGMGNTLLSVLEDVATFIGAPLAIFLPVVAFLLALLGLFAAVFAISMALRAGKRLLRLFDERAT